MGNVNHLMKIGLPKDQWRGEILEFDPTFHPSEVVAVYGYKHRLPDYRCIPEKVQWVLRHMNQAQQQVFIRLLGLDNNHPRPCYKIVEDADTTPNWVRERKREIKKLLERLKFSEILQGKLPFPPEETSAP